MCRKYIIRYRWCNHTSNDDTRNLQNMFFACNENSCDNTISLALPSEEGLCGLCFLDEDMFIPAVSVRPALYQRRPNREALDQLWESAVYHQDHGEELDQVELDGTMAMGDLTLSTWAMRISAREILDELLNDHHWRLQSYLHGLPQLGLAELEFMLQLRTAVEHCDAVLAEQRWTPFEKRGYEVNLDSLGEKPDVCAICYLRPGEAAQDAACETDEQEREKKAKAEYEESAGQETKNGGEEDADQDLWEDDPEGDPSLGHEAHPEEEIWVEVPCGNGHKYHRHCVRDWIKQGLKEYNATCPMCRNKIHESHPEEIFVRPTPPGHPTGGVCPFLASFTYG